MADLQKVSCARRVLVAPCLIALVSYGYREDYLVCYSQLKLKH